MVACPHCQFENPTQNRFCQRCGNALKGLRAIVLPAKLAAAASSSAAEPSWQRTIPPELHMVEGRSDAETGLVEVADLLTAEHHFKTEPRYQLRTPEAAQQTVSAEVILDVLDCQPAQNSPFEQQLSDPQLESSEVAIETVIPSAALPYWQLQEQFFPMVPELQSAWEEKDCTIIILEDRSGWKTLDALAAANQVEALELVHWFYEIVNLWNALAEFNAETSLLVSDNLRVDDDQILCVQRLIYNADQTPKTLKDLGLFWQAWLQKVPQVEVPALANLVADMGGGIICDYTTITEILATIAENLDDAANDVVAVMPPVPTEPYNITIPFEVAMTSGTASPPALELSDLLLTEDIGEFAATELNLEALDDTVNDLPTMALPMKLSRVDEVGRTHVGRQRTHNEDCFFAETQLQRTDSPSGNTLKARGIYILCDGMGGHSGGEVASALAVSTLREYFCDRWQTALPDEATITEAILQANQVIYDKNEAEGRSGNARMGTTLVMVLLDNNQAVVAHVGDSRLYCVTRHGLQQATVDHEVGQREINRGVEPAIAYARPDAYQLTQALGPRGNSEVKPSITTLPITQDTLFLLCSDGLSDNDLLEDYLDTHVEPLLRSRTNLEDGVANLIDLANEHNGHDNITVIAVRIKMQPNLEAVQSGADEITEPLNLTSDSAVEPD